MALKRKKKTKRTAKKRTKRSLGHKKQKKEKKQRKIVFIVVDGLADMPQNGKTPLSIAKTPNLDWFAANGACGELGLIPRSIAKKLYKHVVWSHVANVSLLSFNPARYYLRRGPLEAVGVGIPYREGHLAIRCNFATVDRELRLIDRRAGRAAYGLDEIARHINTHLKIGPRFVLIRTYGHRAVLVIKERLSDQITSNDPYKTGVKPHRVEALNPKAQRAAELVQSFVDKSHRLIVYHTKNAERIDKGLPPANYLLVREAGNKVVALPNFNKKWHTHAVCIAENGVMKATCMLAGFNSIAVPELGPEETLDFIFDNIDTALTEYDFVYAHFKGADEPAHDGDFDRKRLAIEEIDCRLGSFRNFDGILVLTCDHITSCKHKSHMQGSVPVLVHGKKKDAVKKFDERSVKKGSLKKMSGRELMKYIFGK